jgi:peptide-methionine (R)-S-oxide reductase
MKTTSRYYWALLAGLMAVGFVLVKVRATEIGQPENLSPVAVTAADRAPVVKIHKTEAEWKAQLTPQQFAVLREKGTERSASSPLNEEKAKGVYRCAACGLPLFASDAKFESGTGWPSFWKPFVAANVYTAKDNTLGMERDEVLCARCGSHLGHRFDDGPKPTGMRYCLNGVALKFEPRP